MKTLLILRHAKSSWDNSVVNDHDRPLNDRGLKDAPNVGTMLKENKLIPDAILSSTARRAQDTARLAVKSCGFKNDVLLIPDFYPGTARHYIQTLNQLHDEHESVMVVGHNPGLEELLTTLTGIREQLPTAALVSLELPITKWKELSPKTQAKLINIWCPKENN